MLDVHKPSTSKGMSIMHQPFREKNIIIQASEPTVYNAPWVMIFLSIILFSPGILCRSEYWQGIDVLLLYAFPVCL